jgi:hypothetical protein
MFISLGLCTGTTLATATRRAIVEPTREHGQRHRLRVQKCHRRSGGGGAIYIGMCETDRESPKVRTRATHEPASGVPAPRTMRCMPKMLRSRSFCRIGAIRWNARSRHARARERNRSAPSLASRSTNIDRRNRLPASGPGRTERASPTCSSSATSRCLSLGAQRAPPAGATPPPRRRHATAVGLRS